MENTAISINLIRILNVLKKRWYIVLFFIVFCGLASFYYTSNFVTKTYRATVQMYVYSKENSYMVNGQVIQQTQTASDLSLRTLLINDCLEAVKLQDVVDKVNNGLKNEGISKHISTGNISSSAQEGTRFFFVSITSSDPELCNKAIKLLANASLDKIKSLLQVDNVQVVNYNLTDSNRAISPNIPVSSRNGALTGLVIGFVIIVLLAMADRTIKDEEEFTALFGNIPVIGSIPEFNLAAERSAASKARKTAQRSNRQQQPGRSLSDDINNFSGSSKG